MIDYKYFKVCSFLILIGFLIAIIFNLGYLFVIFYVLMIGLVILKIVYWKKGNKFSERKKILKLHRLIRNHCKDCIYYNKKFINELNKRNRKVYGKNYFKIVCCRNKYSFKRINCISNYVDLMKTFVVIENLKLSGKKLIEFLCGKNERKENC